MSDFLCSNYHDLGLGLLCGLRPKFHHEEHKPINTNYKDNNNARVSPSIILCLEVQRLEVIRTLGVLTYTASSRGIWVEEICSCSHAVLIAGKIFATGLVGRRVEYSKLFRFAMNRLVPGSENKQRTHEVVERVDVVYPGRNYC